MCRRGRGRLRAWASASLGLERWGGGGGVGGKAPDDGRDVIIVLDAKRDQIFTAWFERDLHGWVEREPAHLDSLTAMLARSPRPVFLLGEGIPYHEKFLPKDDRGVIVTPADCWPARAEAV